MKPLTIEELKALQVGDWVWIVDTERQKQIYVRKDAECAIDVIIENLEDEFAYTTADEFGAFDYSFYGKTWLAYKNKEQAETKGEIVELPCRVGDKAWRVYDLGAMSSIEKVYVTDIIIDDRYIGIGFSQTGSRLTLKRNGERISTQNVYLDKSEAERRLAELRGEQ